MRCDYESQAVNDSPASAEKAHGHIPHGYPMYNGTTGPGSLLSPLLSSPLFQSDTGAAQPARHTRLGSRNNRESHGKAAAHEPFSIWRSAASLSSCLRTRSPSSTAAGIHRPVLSDQRIAAFDSILSSLFPQSLARVSFPQICVRARASVASPTT